MSRADTFRIYLEVWPSFVPPSLNCVLSAVCEMIRFVCRIVSRALRRDLHVDDGNDDCTADDFTCSLTGTFGT